MLNYIWGGLLVSSLLFAAVHDATDLARDAYRNGEPLPVELTFPEGRDPEARTVPVEIRIDPESYQAFYGVEEAPAGTWPGTLRRTGEGTVLRFAPGIDLPEPLATIREASQARDGGLQGTLVGLEGGEEPGGPGAPGGGGPTDTSAAASGQDTDAVTEVAAVRFDPVRFVKMNAIAAAALDFAETAAEIALGLIGVLALFLGLLKIGEDAGIIHGLVRLVRPVLRPLFPRVPDDHPALGMIALNMAANVFGLGNAATPFGIKAMEELQELNPSDDTATDAMVMLLAINTASVQLVPPVLLLALMGLQINQLIFAIWITTGLSLLVAVVAAKLYGRLPGNRATDPQGTGGDGPPGGDPGPGGGSPGAHPGGPAGAPASSPAVGG
jgi:spore maturation protein A